MIVIGGGPAGSTVATLVKKARPAARVVLCERSAFPRHHVGESLLPNANPVLAKLGVTGNLQRAGFLRKGGVSIKWLGNRPLFSEWFANAAGEGFSGRGDDQAVPANSWQVERSRYDSLLLDHAVSSGVEVWQPASIVDVHKTGDRVSGVVVDRGGVRSTVEAGFVVDCSGQSRLLGRLLGIPIIEHDLGNMAVYRYYEGAAWSKELLGEIETSKIFFAATPLGWVWYIPLSPVLVSVGVVIRKSATHERDLDAVFDEQLATVPEMVAMLRDARRTPPPGTPSLGIKSHVIANWSYAYTRAAGPGFYLAGDAAAFVDPVLSSGVMLAHHAGMWVANAIQTELDHPDVDPATLHSAYTRIYEDARSSFEAMGTWWYHMQGSSESSWFDRATEIMRERNVRGAEGLDEVSVFLYLAAGFLTDFRFTHVGMGGWGASGVATLVNSLYGQGARNTALDKADGASLIRRAWDRCVCEEYLGTSVETDRWWRLPMLRFHRGDEVELYRPRVRILPSGEPDVARTITAIEALLAACEATITFGDLKQEIRRHAGDAPIDALVLEGVTELACDLVRLRLLVPDESRIAPRRDLGDRGRPLRRAYARAELMWREPVSFQRGAEAFPLLAFHLDGKVRAYRPSPGELRVAKALLEACNGQRSIEALVREAQRRLRAGNDRELHRLAGVMLAEFVRLGVLVPAGGERG